MKRRHVRSERQNRLARIRARRAVRTIVAHVRLMVAEKRLSDAIAAAHAAVAEALGAKAAA
jgi:hypothetical protein